MVNFVKVGYKAASGNQFAASSHLFLDIVAFHAIDSRSFLAKFWELGLQWGVVWSDRELRPDILLKMIFILPARTAPSTVRSRD
jgi:hypothetical protein